MLSVNIYLIYSLFLADSMERRWKPRGDMRYYSVPEAVPANVFWNETKRDETKTEC